MANLPAVTQPEHPTKLAKSQRLAAELLMDGHSLTVVSNKLAKQFGKTPRQWRRVMRRWMAHSELFQQEIAALSAGSLGLDLPRVVKAVGNRAARGNPNMARLALEATGFHNPKVDHKHSGEVKITVAGIPRPSAGPDETPPVVDAEVVED